MYIQNDKKWGNISWYDESVCELLRDFTNNFQNYAKDDKYSNELLNITNKLNERIKKIVNEGEYKQTEEMSSSFSESGCWHTSVANMMTLFNVRIERKTPTPLAVLQALQNKMLGTLTGYVETPFIDPISIITNEKVQLSKYRDFGRGGTDKNNHELELLLSTAKDENTCAIINVCSHEFKGRGDSHYVLVTKQGKQDYEIQDPGSPEITSLFDGYNKYYQVSVYTKY